jgi:2-keto-3-deoxy-L-rhamnonate aldolase RhmA
MGGPRIPEIIDDVRERARRRGIACGILSRNIDDIKARRDQGFGMVGLGSDIGMVIRHLNDVRGELGLQQHEHDWF